MFICTHPSCSFDRSQDLTELFQVAVPSLLAAVDLLYGESISAELMPSELQNDFKIRCQNLELT